MTYRDLLTVIPMGCWLAKFLASKLQDGLKFYIAKSIFYLMLFSDKISVPTDFKILALNLFSIFQPNKQKIKMIKIFKGDV